MVELIAIDSRLMRGCDEDEMICKSEIISDSATGADRIISNSVSMYQRWLYTDKTILILVDKHNSYRRRRDACKNVG